MKHRLFLVLVFLAYIIGMSAVMIFLGIGIAPDRYFFVLLLGALLINKLRDFLFDWIPFLFILISYDFLRGITSTLHFRINFTPQINIERYIFGVIPTNVLQDSFFKTGHLNWYDYLSAIIYFLHFALPLGFAYILWIYKKSFFKEFITGVSLLSYAGWVTYVIFPAAPPWMAGDQGYIPKVIKILTYVFNSFPDKLHLPTLYWYFNPNDVAAIPSMHAAYPFLVLLFGLHFFGKKFIIFLFYVLICWISIVYLGEHYVVDIIIGAIYATIFYLLSVRILHKNPKLFIQYGKKLKKVLLTD